MSTTYKDPLHVPSAKLVVWHKGKEKSLIDKALLDKQNCWQNLELIKELCSNRLHIEDQMAEIDSFLDLPDAIKNLNDQWTEIQFKLQEAWGFERNSKMHRFWDIPACECPKLDNDDAYPSGYYVIDENCKLHWRHNA